MIAGGKIGIPVGAARLIWIPNWMNAIYSQAVAQRDPSGASVLATDRYPRRFHRELPSYAMEYINYGLDQSIPLDYVRLTFKISLM
jgi:hypothetical protein